MPSARPSAIYCHEGIGYQDGTNPVCISFEPWYYLCAEYERWSSFSPWALYTCSLCATGGATSSPSPLQ